MTSDETLLQPPDTTATAIKLSERQLRGMQMCRLPASGRDDYGFKYFTRYGRERSSSVPISSSGTIFLLSISKTLQISILSLSVSRVAASILFNVKV